MVRSRGLILRGIGTGGTVRRSYPRLGTIVVSSPPVAPMQTIRASGSISRIAAAVASIGSMWPAVPPPVSAIDTGTRLPGFPALRARPVRRTPGLRGARPSGLP